MLKKGLIKTCIYEYIDSNSLESIPDIIKALPEIYEHLKNHPHHKDLLKLAPSNRECSYEEFVHWTKVGLHQAANGGNIFSKLKKQFNSF